MEGSFYLYKATYEHSLENFLTIAPSGGHRTDIRCLAPDGEPLTIGTDASTGNCTGGRATTVVMYGGDVMSAIDVGLYVDGQSYITTEGLDSDMQIVRIQQMASASKGILEMTIPVDVTKSEVATTAEGWQSAELKFALTPTNILANEIRKNEGLEYSFYTSYLLNCGEWQATIGQGIGGDRGTTASGRVSFWGGYDTECPISVIMQQAGAVLSGSDSAIRALPMRGTRNGIEVLSPNTMFETNMLCATEETIPLLCQNQLLAQMPDENMVLGNCAPALVTIPLPGRVMYGFNGRHCEAMGIDAFDWSVLNHDFIDQVNGRTSKVVVKDAAGNVIVDDISGLYTGDEWADNDPYTAEISTDNILIDGSIKGCTSGTMKWIPGGASAMPTVTAMLFTSDDKICSDRIDNTADTKIAVYAAGITDAFSEYTHNLYCHYELPGDLKIEYAPFNETHTYESWTNLSVEPKLEYYDVPGWGGYYEASLQSLPRATCDTWYAVRITTSNATGDATQTQVISPAFMVTGSTGGKTLSDPGNREHAIYYNMQGMRVDKPESGQMVIELRGSQSTKRVFR